MQKREEQRQKEEEEQDMKEVRKTKRPGWCNCNMCDPSEQICTGTLYLSTLLHHDMWIHFIDMQHDIRVVSTFLQLDTHTHTHTG